VDEFEIQSMLVRTRAGSSIESPSAGRKAVGFILGIAEACMIHSVESLRPQDATPQAVQVNAFGQLLPTMMASIQIYAGHKL
jgi:hypothetical protein